MIGDSRSTTQDKHNVAIGQSYLLLGRLSTDQTLIHMGSKGQTTNRRQSPHRLLSPAGRDGRDSEGIVIDQP